MGKQRVTTWYVYPRNADTNEVLSSALSGLHSQEKFSTIECAGGEKRELVEVPNYAFVSRLYKSRTALRLDFQVYRSQDGGKPDVWIFHTRKKTTLQNLEARGIIRRGNTPHRKSATRF